MEKVNYEFIIFECLSNEAWSFIPNISCKYIVSTHGRVALLCKGQFRLASTSVTANGYSRVFLSVDGHRKPYYVHRLVAMAFIPNPNDYPQVNHIDENRLNNHVENLEWCAAKHNLEHSNIIQKWSSSGTAASLEARKNKTYHYFTLKDLEHECFKEQIKKKVANLKRTHSKRNILAYDRFHNCTFYDGISEAVSALKLNPEHIFASACFNDKGKELKYHTNGLFFSFGYDFWSWIITNESDVSLYFI